MLPTGRVLGVFADRPLHRPQLAQLAHATRTLAGHLLVMVPVAGPGPDALARLRAQLGDDVDVVESRSQLLSLR